MMTFCTLFDSNYISKGIALYLSIAKHTDDFVLYVMAMDRKCEEQLKQLAFSHMVVECIDDNMFPSLEQAKGNRSRAEFCWTCGSVVTHLFFEKYQLPEITYLDSDLMFFNSPAIIDDELKRKNASVGLSPHFIHNTLFGVYCVQYVYFRRDKNGVACLKWWKDECLKWCYSQLEDGKYGDQKYLDYMHEKFDGVVDIENRGAGIANWNMEQYRYDFENKTLWHHDKQWPIVFFHYNGLNTSVKDGQLRFVHGKYFTKSVMRGFIMPYSYLLTKVYREYLGVEISGFSYKPLSGWKNMLNAFWVRIRNHSLSIKMEKAFMDYKYSERKSPYSERKM